MFRAGERPNRHLAILTACGVRLRGWCACWWTLPESDRACSVRPTFGTLVGLTRSVLPLARVWVAAGLFEFLLERLRYVLEQRGFDVRNVRAVTAGDAAGISPLQARRKVEVLPELTESADFAQLALLFKRVRNIARNLPDGAGAESLDSRALALTHPAETALLGEIDQRRPPSKMPWRPARASARPLARPPQLAPAVAKFLTMCW